MKNEALLKLRKHLKFSQKELGKKLGISQTRIYLYENGREIPSNITWEMVGLAESAKLDLPFEKFYSRNMLKTKISLDPQKELEMKFKCAELNLKIKDAVIEEQRKIIKDISNN